MIYFCIPAWNEANTIGVLLWKIRQVMMAFPRDYELLVLDDGSTDDTEQVLAPYLRVLPLTVLRNRETQGYAASTERLLREAVRRSTHPRRDVVVTMQADFTEAPDDIPALVKRVEGGADLVTATVQSPIEGASRAMHWARRGLPWLLRRRGIPAEVRDPLSGFRAYRVSVLKRALAELNGDRFLTVGGWAANAELLLAVAPHVRRAEDAAVSMRYDFHQRGSRFRPWNTLVDFWDLSRRQRVATTAPAASGAAE